MDDNWTLMKLGLPETPTHLQYLASLGEEARVGVASKLMPMADFRELEKGGLPIEGVESDLVEMVRDELVCGRGMGRQVGEIMVLAQEYAGQSSDHEPAGATRGGRARTHITTCSSSSCLCGAGQSVSAKLDNLRASLKASGHEGMIVTSLDEIAWTTNLRGADIDFNPGTSPFNHPIHRRSAATVLTFENPCARFGHLVFFSYLLVTPTAALLFLPDAHAAKLSPEVRHHLVAENIKIESYERVWEKLGEIKFSLVRHIDLSSGGARLSLDPTWT